MEGTIEPRGGFIERATFVGHEFSYDLDDHRHFVTVTLPQPNAVGTLFVLLHGDNVNINVRCELERQLDDGALRDVDSPFLEIAVKPYWAPRAASRFLELVRGKYYDGVALNRVVPQFLVQFGIAKDHEQRMRWDKLPILDDILEHRKQFQPGFISFAGNGPDSRTTEIFIVMPGTDQEQLDYFGENSWETPFALLDVPARRSILTAINGEYGDMPPWGTGPDPDRIYDLDGYTSYLPENFPNLDYIKRCFIVDEEIIEDESAEL